ncbi:hypothetical protein MC885_007727, partial [Smutsia gigantea]
MFIQISLMMRSRSSSRWARCSSSADVNTFLFKVLSKRRCLLTDRSDAVSKLPSSLSLLSLLLSGSCTTFFRGCRRQSVWQEILITKAARVTSSWPEIQPGLHQIQTAVNCPGSKRSDHAQQTLLEKKATWHQAALLVSRQVFSCLDFLAAPELKEYWTITISTRLALVYNSLLSSPTSPPDTQKSFPSLAHHPNPPHSPSLTCG